MRLVAEHRWSLLSILITVGAAPVMLSIIYFLHRRGIWQPASALGTRMAGLGGLAVLTSFVLACVSLAKEKSAVYGLIALCLSILRFFLYVHYALCAVIC